jgi:hypothetical protein
MQIGLPETPASVSRGTGQVGAGMSAPDRTRTKDGNRGKTAVGELLVAVSDKSADQRRVLPLGIDEASRVSYVHGKLSALALTPARLAAKNIPSPGRCVGLGLLVY